LLSCLQKFIWRNFEGTEQVAVFPNVKMSDRNGVVIAVNKFIYSDKRASLQANIPLPQAGRLRLWGDVWIDEKTIVYCPPSP
jgi:hypothetical protein